MESIITIQNKILDIRGQKVILDFELARMYGIETKVLKQTVKRNITRFPSDFMSELSELEFSSLRSQIVTSNLRGGNRYKPYAFTEMGVAMLSSVLRSDIAIQVNISIMRAFVMMRQMVTEAKAAPITHLEQKVDKLSEYVEDILRDQNDINEDVQMQLENISEVIAELQVTHKSMAKPRKSIGFIHD